jgi:hypothetical protein
VDDIETIAKNSFRNFHVKGFNYLCLSRSLLRTEKVYFFPDDLAFQPELVMPHNHRYDFITEVIAGSVRNKLYRPSTTGPRFDVFSYRTPLNGGNGFSWSHETSLDCFSSTMYQRGDIWESKHHEIHTLQVLERGTIIKLTQFQDVFPLHVGTQSYRVVGSREPPNLDGLYDEMTPDASWRLLKVYQSHL